MNPEIVGFDKEREMKTPRIFGSLSLCWMLFSVAAVAQEPPKFDSTSDEAVLLRYRSSEGASFPIHMNMDIAMDMEMGGMTMKMPMRITMSGVNKTVSVTPEGNFNAEMIIERVTMDMDAMGMKMAFDSTKTPEPQEPQYKPLAAMVGKPVKMTYSPLGKVSEIDMAAMTSAMKEAGPASSGKGTLEQLDQMVNSSFVSLPENPVRAGDTYDGGEMVQDIPDLGELRFHAQYKVVAVSGDKSQVLLEPIMDLTVKPSGDSKAPLDAKLDKSGGWLLFDVSRGNISQSFITMDMTMHVEQMGQKMNMVMNTKSAYSTLE